MSENEIKAKWAKYYAGYSQSQLQTKLDSLADVSNHLTLPGNAGTLDKDEVHFQMVVLAEYLLPCEWEPDRHLRLNAVERSLGLPLTVVEPDGSAASTGSPLGHVVHFTGPLCC